MRIHTTSTGLEPASLVPGADLVLELDDAHGVDVAEGVLAHDHLDLASRRAVDEATVDAVARWTQATDGPLTVDGVQLPWIWELDLIQDVFLPTVTDAAALDAALRYHRPAAITLMDREPHTERIVRAVASHRGLPVEVHPGGPRRAGRRAAKSTLSGPRRLRRSAVQAALSLGVPSRTRAGSVLFLSYWPLVSLLDKLLAGAGPRPAIWLGKRPAGPARSFRAARAGGWVGLPGLVGRARAGRAARRALRAAKSAPDLEVLGLPLGEPLHREAMELAHRRAAADLALAPVFRRALAGGRVSKVLLPFDVDPQMRLVASLAREADVRTLLVAHGVYPLRHTVVDMQVADEVAAWSPTFGPTVWRWDRPLHVVGYPVPHDIAPARDRPPADRPPLVLVPGHGKERATSMFDDRYSMRHYLAAIEAISAALPGARVLLRPHPAEGRVIVQTVADRFPGVDVSVDTAADVNEAVAGVDLCIGTSSTISFQAALAGTPVVVLNVAGYEWGWPLGGRTRVPVAHSAAELAERLEAWRANGGTMGREELLEALGAGQGDAASRLLALLER